MKADPSKQNLQSSIKTAVNSDKIETLNPMNTEEYDEEKHILDLLMSPMSPNQVCEHFKNSFRQQRKSHKIRSVLLKNKCRIKVINKKFDFIVFPMLTLLEIDETFKGRNVSLLVVIDTFTGYIFHIQWLKERSKEGILKSLEPIRELFLGVTLVLTDGALYFPEVVKELCPMAKHQICLIHVMRGIYRLLRPLQGKYKKSMKSCMVSRKKRKKVKINNGERRYTLKLHKAKDRYWKANRERKRLELGVKPYQKDVLVQYPELKTFNLKINEIGGLLRADVKAIGKNKQKIVDLDISLTYMEKGMYALWGDYMKQIHYIYRFYDLFHLKNKEYQLEKVKYLTSISNISNNDLVTKIRTILTTVSSLDTVNKADSPIRLTRNYINTNVVESANAKIRPHLDHLRKIQNTEYTQTYFNLLRLKLNVSRPFSGQRRFTSPIERYGYDLRCRSWLDLIIDGLPPGPQYGINSSKIDFEVACPQRIGKCIIK